MSGISLTVHCLYQLNAGCRTPEPLSWKTIGYEKIEPNDCDHYDGDARDSEGHVCDKCLKAIREERFSFTVADIEIISAALKSNAEMRKANQDSTGEDVVTNQLNPIRVQRKRTKGWRMPPNTVYVGRGTKWGNPFIIGQTVRVDVDQKLATGDNDFQYLTMTPVLAVEFYRQRLEIILNEPQPELIDALRGKNLACFCAPSQPCHADILLELANK